MGYGGLFFTLRQPRAPQEGSEKERFCFYVTSPSRSSVRACSAPVEMR